MQHNQGVAWDQEYIQPSKKISGGNLTYRKEIMASMVSMSSAEFEQSFDFNALDELDPSLADGFKIVYDREVCLYFAFFVAAYQLKVPLRITLYCCRCLWRFDRM